MPRIICYFSFTSLLSAFFFKAQSGSIKSTIGFEEHRSSNVLVYPNEQLTDGKKKVPSDMEDCCSTGPICLFLGVLCVFILLWSHELDKKERRTYSSHPAFDEDIVDGYCTFVDSDEVPGLSSTRESRRVESGSGCLPKSPSFVIEVYCIYFNLILMYFNMV